MIISFHKKRRDESALTLVEMLVATTLLVVIMLGLTMMFNQTQRAFRTGLKQVDVFEGGRAVMDMIARDVEQAVRSQSVDDWSFVAGLPPAPSRLTQDLPGGGTRENLLYELFLLNQKTRWSAIGYRVLDHRNVNGTGHAYGTLYRFQTNFFEFNRNFPNEHYNTFTKNPSVLTNQSLNRVAEGIVHLRVRLYNSSGELVPPRNAAGNVIYNTNITEVRLESWPNYQHEPTVIYSNSVPALVEVELGILEPQTLKQAESLPDNARINYLERQAGKIHVFRQKIPIRNAPR